MSEQLILRMLESGALSAPEMYHHHMNNQGEAATLSRLEIRVLIDKLLRLKQIERTGKIRLEHHLRDPQNRNLTHVWRYRLSSSVASPAPTPVKVDYQSIEHLKERLDEFLLMRNILVSELRTVASHLEKL